MGVNHNTNKIWRYADVEIKPSGAYVKLIAFCGLTRRVTPETARQFAEDLLRAARKAEEASLSSEKQVVIDQACEKLDEMEAMETLSGACMGILEELGGGGALKERLDTPLQPEPPKSGENTCAEDATMHILSPHSLRLIVITIRRALGEAIKLCDKLAEQLKTK